MSKILGYGRYEDDPNHVGCPRAKTDALRRREAGMSYLAIATALGVGDTTVRRWLNPEYAERARASSRALKERYRGSCETCGQPTSGCNGPGKAPRLCIACFILERRPDHGTPSRYQGGCLCDACREANRIAHRELGGRPPPTHGESGYTNYGCRCDICKRAGAAKNRRCYQSRVALSA